MFNKTKREPKPSFHEQVDELVIRRAELVDQLSDLEIDTEESVGFLREGVIDGWQNGRNTDYISIQQEPIRHEISKIDKQLARLSRQIGRKASRGSQSIIDV